jgi:hypothetical protein
MKSKLPVYALIFALGAGLFAGGSIELPGLPASAANGQDGKVVKSAKQPPPSVSQARQQPAAKQSHSPWAAYYEFFESEGPNTMMDMMYKLTISQGQGSDLKAVLDVDGHMTGIRANCQALVKGDSCQIRYLGDHVDPVDPSYKAMARFKPNDLLFTLTRRKGKLITRFYALDPLETKHNYPGVYFEKTNPLPEIKEQPVPKSLQIQPSDLRPNLRVLLQKNRPDKVDLGDNFSGELNARSIVVNIGAALDQFRSADLNVGQQLAATIFFKANNTDVESAQEAISECYIGKESANRAGDDVTVHLFRTKSGRIAHIFIYFNDLFGLLGVMEMGPPHKGKTTAANWNFASTVGL